MKKCNDLEVLKNSIDHSKTIGEIQEVIDNMLTTIDRHYEKISKDPNLKTILSMIFGTTTYLSGAKVLLANPFPQYDSMLPLCRSFIEGYAILIEMIEKYSESSEFRTLFKKLLACDMEQDRKIYNSINSDNTISDEFAKQNDLKTFIVRWENMIKQYYPLEAGDIDVNNKDNSLMDIIKNLDRSYKNEFPYMNDKSIFIGNAIENNKAYLTEVGEKYINSHAIYRMLCSETHLNIGTVDARTIYNGEFCINMSNLKNGLAAIDLMSWCTKDITFRFEEILV